MAILDRILQNWRFSKAAPYVPENVRLLDAGSADGRFMQRLAHRVTACTGVDTVYTEQIRRGKLEFVPGRFPDRLQQVPGPFGVICFIAVLEHLVDQELPECAARCAELLQPGGRIIITLPAPQVDNLVRILKLLRLAEAETLDEHHGQSPEKVLSAFLKGPFELLVWKKFQLGLNNLIVMQRQ